MNNFPIWKWLSVLFIIIFAIIFSIPTYLYKEDSENWF